MTGWALLGCVLAFLVGLACGVLSSICYAGYVLGSRVVQARERASVAAAELEQAIRKASQPYPN
jgi:preprotein translocase subunit SecF